MTAATKRGSASNLAATATGFASPSRVSCDRRSPDSRRRHQPIHRAAALGNRRQLLPHRHPGTRGGPLPDDRRRVPRRWRHDHRIRHRRRRADAPLQAAATGLRDMGRRHGLGTGGAVLSAVHGDLRPQCLDHHHDRLHRRAAAGDPENGRGPRRDAQGAGQCRPQLQPDADRSNSGRSCFRRRCRPSLSASGSG